MRSGNRYLKALTQLKHTCAKYRVCMYMYRCACNLIVCHTLWVSVVLVHAYCIVVCAQVNPVVVSVCRCRLICLSFFGRLSSALNSARSPILHPPLSRLFFMLFRCLGSTSGSLSFSPKFKPCNLFSLDGLRWFESSSEGRYVRGPAVWLREITSKH